MNVPDPNGAPLTVGYVSPGWPKEATPNGIVAYLENVSSRLKSWGHRVSILAPIAPGTLDDPTVYAWGEGTDRRPFLSRLANSLEYRIAPDVASQRQIRGRLLGAIHRAISEQQMQILQMEESFGWAWWVKKSIGIPLCVRLHGPWFLNGAILGIPQDAQYRRRVENERRGIASADMITAPSRDVLEQTREYYKLPLENAEVIPNPVIPVSPSDQWRLDGCDPKRVLFIGRFDRHKGGDLVIESFARIVREVPDARLTFVGPDRTCAADDGKVWKLEDFIRDRMPGALESGRIEWLGQQPSSALHALRRKALMCIVPSRYENFANTATEAISLGCPVVAADTGGMPEIVRDNDTGLLHRPSDVDDLARKVITLLKDPTLAASLGARAFDDSLKRFHPDLIAARHVDVYRSVLGRRRNAG